MLNEGCLSTCSEAKQTHQVSCEMTQSSDVMPVMMTLGKRGRVIVKVKVVHWVAAAALTLGKCKTGILAAVHEGRRVSGGFRELRPWSPWKDAHKGKLSECA